MNTAAIIVIAAAVVFLAPITVPLGAILHNEVRWRRERLYIKTGTSGHVEGRHDARHSQRIGGQG